MDAVDLAIARWVADHRASPLTSASRLLEDLGTSPVVFAIIGLVSLGAVAALRLWAGLPQVVVAVLVTAVATRPLKGWFDRPRPSGDLTLTTLYEPAMPSSHAVMTSSVAVAVLMAPWWTSALLRKVFVAVAVVGCVVVAAAMVYLGGHWVSDILVGWLLGIGITGGVMLAWQRWLPDRRAVDAPYKGE